MKNAWMSVQCSGHQEVTQALVEADEKGAFERIVVFCGLAIKDQGNIVNPQRAIPEPQFAVFVKIPVYEPFEEHKIQPSHQA